MRGFNVSTWSTWDKIFKMGIENYLGNTIRNKSWNEFVESFGLMILYIRKMLEKYLLKLEYLITKI